MPRAFLLQEFRPWTRLSKQGRRWPPRPTSQQILSPPKDSVQQAQRFPEAVKGQYKQICYYRKVRDWEWACRRLRDKSSWQTQASPLPQAKAKATKENG